MSSEIACGSNHSPPWKWGLGTDETWVKSLSLCGLWGLEGTRRYLSPSREVAAAIPRSQGGRATHAGVDRRWHAVCDTEGIDERHTGARLHGGTRDPRRGVTEGQSSVSSPASGNCSGTRGTSARHTGARATTPGFKPLKPRYHVYPVGRRRTSHAQRRDQLGASLVPPTIFPKARSNVPTAPQSGILSFSVSINTPPGKCSTRRRPSRHPRVSTETHRAHLPHNHSHSTSFPHPSIDRTNPRRWAARRTPRRPSPHSPRTASPPSWGKRLYAGRTAGAAPAPSRRSGCRTRAPARARTAVPRRRGARPSATYRHPSEEALTLGGNLPSRWMAGYRQPARIATRM